MFTRESCPLCGSPQQHRWFHHGRVRVVRCGACALRYVADLLDDEELRAYYTGRAEIRHRDWRESTDPKLTSRLSEIRTLVPAPARLLDIGCGLGEFVARAERAGYDAVGLEIAADIAERAHQVNGVSVISDPLEAVPDASFDVVTLLDVIEHVYDPVGVIRHCGRILRPSGLLVIDTPNGSSGYDRLLSLFRAPSLVSGRFSHSHVQIFTPHQLRSALGDRFRIREHRTIHELSLPMDELSRRTRIPLWVLRTGDSFGLLPKNKQVVLAHRR